MPTYTPHQCSPMCASRMPAPKIDVRDFKHSDYFAGILPAALPQGGIARMLDNSFVMIEQETTTWCTGANTSTAASYAWRVPMSFEWQIAAIARISGVDLITGGADNRKAMEAQCTLGSLPQKQATLTLDKNGTQAGAYSSWAAEQNAAALPFAEQSYFRIDTGPYDAFTNIQIGLYLADQAAQYEAQQTGQPKKEYVGMIFSQWYSAMSGLITNPDGTFTYGGIPVDVDYVPPVKSLFASIWSSIFGDATEVWHAYTLMNWTMRDQMRMVAKNSYGPGFGDYGVQYFSRATINALLTDPRAGVYLFRDVAPGDVQAQQQVTINQQVLNALLNNGLVNYFAVWWQNRYGNR